MNYLFLAHGIQVIHILIVVMAMYCIGSLNKLVLILWNIAWISSSLFLGDCILTVLSNYFFLLAEHAEYRSAIEWLDAQIQLNSQTTLIFIVLIVLVYILPLIVGFVFRGRHKLSGDGT